MKVELFEIDSEKARLMLIRAIELRSNMNIEIAGFKIRSGKSAYALAKLEFGLRGNRESVLKQLTDLIGSNTLESLYQK